jgi:hypothetical protein
LDTADHTLDTTDYSIDSRATDRPGRRDASVNRATGDMQRFPNNIHLGSFAHGQPARSRLDVRPARHAAREQVAG